MPAVGKVDKLEIGIVTMFDRKRGFGFISKTLKNPETNTREPNGERIFFHVSKGMLVRALGDQLVYTNPVLSHGPERQRLSTPAKHVEIVFERTTTRKGPEAKVWTFPSILLEADAKAISRVPLQPIVVSPEHQRRSYRIYRIVSKTTDPDRSIFEAFCRDHRGFSYDRLARLEADDISFYIDDMTLAQRGEERYDEVFVVQAADHLDGDWVDIKYITPLPGYDTSEPFYGHCKECKAEMTESEDAVGDMCTSCVEKKFAAE